MIDLDINVWVCLWLMVRSIILKLAETTAHTPGLPEVARTSQPIEENGVNNKKARKGQ